MKDKIYDGNGKEVIVDKESFKLCQQNVVITDKKFESKPTTFAKDAFRRFLKNKASVVAAVIIAILLAGSVFLPILLPGNISKVKPAEGFLEPKLFNAGTGFWDGTKKFKNIVYDIKLQKPAGEEFVASAVKNIKLSNEGDYFVDAYSEYAYGGLFVLAHQNALEEGKVPEENLAKAYTYFTLNYNSLDNFKIDLKLSNIDDIYNRKLGQYRFYLEYKNESNEAKRINLTNWSNQYGEKTINISQALQQEGVINAINGRVGFEVLPQTNAPTYIAIEELLFSSSSTNSSIIEQLEAFSMRDANAKIGLLQKSDAGVFPAGSWECIGRRNVYHANIIYSSFTYDIYQAVYGIRVKNDLGRSEMTDYINKGWCSYDFSVGASSFVANSKKCPIKSVIKQSTIKVPGENVTLYTLTAEVSMYRYYGYSSMPRFILGTNGFGYDAFKLTFDGLKVSLALAIAVSAVCLSFGICWGAISGYFGGNIDLMMERFTEILGGIPGIIILTLAILLLGNNIITFAMALCLTGWMGIASRTRHQFYRFKGREYILASRTLGAKDMRLIFRHILPNASGTIVTTAVLMIPAVIGSESTLAYLNLGLQGGKSFGNVLANNQQYLSSYPMLIVFPAIIISLIMISFHLFGNGLRDALNPSLKGSE